MDAATNSLRAPGSCRYFANLAQASKASGDAPIPTQNQLKLVLTRADGATVLSKAQLEALCSQAGISPAIFKKVIEAGRFEDGAEVSVHKFLFLLLAMTCDSFGAVTAGIFELFGSELVSNHFVQLIGHLAPDMDPEVTTQFLADLSSSLMDVEMVDYELVASLECLASKLKS